MYILINKNAGMGDKHYYAVYNSLKDEAWQTVAWGFLTIEELAQEFGGGN